MSVVATRDPAKSAELIRLCDGSVDEKLVRLLEDIAFAMALTRLRDREAALDVAQETMLVVIRAVREGAFLEPEKLENYICGTVRNLVREHLRARYRRDGLAIPGPASVPSAEEEMEETERSCLVRRVLQGLSAPDRQVLVMTIMSELTPSQVAARLGVAPDTLRHRKMRALKRARTLFERLSGTAPGPHPSARNPSV